MLSAKDAKKKQEKVRKEAKRVEEKKRKDEAKAQKSRMTKEANIFKKYLEENLEELIKEQIDKNESEITIHATKANISMDVGGMTHKNLLSYFKTLEELGYKVEPHSSQAKPIRGGDYDGYAPISNFVTISW